MVHFIKDTDGPSVQDQDDTLVGCYDIECLGTVSSGPNRTVPLWGVYENIVTAKYVDASNDTVQLQPSTPVMRTVEIIARDGAINVVMSDGSAFLDGSLVKTFNTSMKFRVVEATAGSPRWATLG